eukprot:2890347-Rhodomonas_salina.1
MPPKNAAKKARIDENGSSCSPSSSEDCVSPTQTIQAVVNPAAMSSVSEDVTGGVAVEKFAADFEHVQLRSFIGNLGRDDKNAKLIMMNTSAIPCCAGKCRDDYKVTLIRLPRPP